MVWEWTPQVVASVVAGAVAAIGATVTVIFTHRTATGTREHAVTTARTAHEHAERLAEQGREHAVRLSEQAQGHAERLAEIERAHADLLAERGRHHADVVAKDEREHADRRAQEELRQARITGVYIEVLSLALRMTTHVEYRNHPDVEERVPWPTPREQTDMYAKIEAFGTRRVRDLMSDLHDAARAAKRSPGNKSLFEAMERARDALGDRVHFECTGEAS